MPTTPPKKPAAVPATSRGTPVKMDSPRPSGFSLPRYSLDPFNHKTALPDKDPGSSVFVPRIAGSRGRRLSIDIVFILSYAYIINIILIKFKHLFNKLYIPLLYIFKQNDPFILPSRELVLEREDRLSRWKIGDCSRR